jgi:hypothetical protein
MNLGGAREMPANGAETVAPVHSTIAKSGIYARNAALLVYSLQFAFFRCQ